MLDLVIENGRLVDGTGNPWFFGDVGIKDGPIVEVGRVNQRGFKTIDAGGQVVSPGFIDGHCHSNLMVLDDPESEIKLQQGSPRRWSGTAQAWAHRARIRRRSGRIRPRDDPGHGHLRRPQTLPRGNLARPGQRDEGRRVGRSSGDWRKHSYRKEHTLAAEIQVDISR
jgi:predicted amidohydrolase YtcJ